MGLSYYSKKPEDVFLGIIYRPKHNFAKVQILQKHLEDYRCRIQELFRQPPDADLSRRKGLWAEIDYPQKRQEGKSHAWALRCLGQRWLKILWKMGQTHPRSGKNIFRNIFVSS